MTNTISTRLSDFISVFLSTSLFLLWRHAYSIFTHKVLSGFSFLFQCLPEINWYFRTWQKFDFHKVFCIKLLAFTERSSNGVLVSPISIFYVQCCYSFSLISIFYVQCCYSFSPISIFYVQCCYSFSPTSIFYVQCCYSFSPISIFYVQCCYGFFLISIFYVTVLL